MGKTVTVRLFSVPEMGLSYGDTKVGRGGGHAMDTHSLAGTADSQTKNPPVILL